MYNRYIPQPDGSYRRKAAPDPPTVPNTPREAPPSPPRHRPSPPPEPISGFLRQLIPKGFDTADLIIVLLFLLIAGDSEESRSNALLTLALYFIL